MIISAVVLLIIMTLLLLFLAVHDIYKKRSYDKYIRLHEKYLQACEKYSGIIDIDTKIEELRSSYEELRSNYKEKRKIFERLVQEAAIYDEEIQLAELGFYKPHFDFDTSEEFKEQITSVKGLQKAMVSAKTAILCTTKWSVDGSRKEGTKMTNRGIRLTARAFNNECDAAIANARWNNALTMEKRIVKAYESINRLNEPNKISISFDYLDLKLRELRLTHEYKEKKHQEREKRAEIQRQIREQQKFEQDVKEAQEEEEKYQKLLEKAKREAEKVTGIKLSELQEKIASLNEKLLAAHQKNERAKSMAEQTKAGHVYVISNIGSFGEDIYKIGMTRRLEPMDRVQELGGASVPFKFDVHAMIYSEDAPSLENELHKTFRNQQVNLMNNRKEFFDIDLADIKREVQKISPNSEFIEIAEARQYRESIAIRSEREQIDSTTEVLSEFPLEI